MDIILIGSFIGNNWGNIASVISLIICIITLMKIKSIESAQTKERKLIKEVLELEDLLFTISDTQTVFKEISNALTDFNDSKLNYLLKIINENSNVLGETIGALSATVKSINLIKDDNKEPIYLTRLKKAESLIIQEKPSEAIKLFKDIIIFYTTLSEIKYIYLILKCNFGITLCNKMQGNIDESKIYLNTTKRLAIKYKISEFIENCDIMEKEIEDVSVFDFLSKIKKRVYF